MKNRTYLIIDSIEDECFLDIYYTNGERNMHIGPYSRNNNHSEYDLNERTILKILVDSTDMSREEGDQPNIVAVYRFKKRKIISKIISINLVATEMSEV
ncbi:MAG: hypothetical protein SGI89_13550 [bacterium]|nr:hypothetical protein [bacterium]